MSVFTDELIAFCLEEWAFFRKGEIKLNGTTVAGRKEYEDGAYERVADYWKEIGGPYKNLTGKDRGYAWSAAFISYAFKIVGAGDKFPYSAGHSKYINKAISNAANGALDAPIVGHKLNSYSLKPGDLIGYWRGGEVISYENARRIGWYESHTDIVVAIDDKFAYAIGGNVNHSVTRRQVRTNARGQLTDRSQNWFVVIQNNL
ncbi:DUF2272 domain-containing protein [Methylopila turkensis]|uniref:DUF2272 domain-containing protein n=1 Tax=Methylopila turkensis TaxID=1437816 RepID=A0A9W6N5L0_9HYPH|nr:DUF2272 domain-containing protein [Methylopila turkensis]GLK78550.1 hypothetical protein GCM10008174_02910 [Methylopila turkensis]